MEDLPVREKSTRCLGSYLGEKRKKSAVSSSKLKAPQRIHAEDILNMEALPLNVLTDILFKMSTWDRLQAARVSGLAPFSIFFSEYILSSLCDSPFLARHPFPSDTSNEQASPSIFRLTSSPHEIYPHILGTLNMTIAELPPEPDMIRTREPSLPAGMWSDRETFYVTSSCQEASKKNLDRDFSERLAFLRPRLPAFHTIRLTMSPTDVHLRPARKTAFALKFFAFLDEAGWKGHLHFQDEFCKPTDREKTFPLLNKLAAKGTTVGLTHPVNRTYYGKPSDRLNWMAVVLGLPQRGTVTHLAFDDVPCHKDVVELYCFDLTALTLDHMCDLFFSPNFEATAQLASTLEAIDIHDFMKDSQFVDTPPVRGEAFVTAYVAMAAMPRLRSLRLHTAFSGKDKWKERGTVVKQISALQPEPVFRAVRELSISVRLGRESEHSPCWPFHHYPALERLELAIDCDAPARDNTVARTCKAERPGTHYNHHIELDSEELGKIRTLKELRINMEWKPDRIDYDDYADDGFLSGATLVDMRPPGTAPPDADADIDALLPLPIKANTDWAMRKKSMRVDYVVFDMESLRLKRRARVRAREFERGVGAAAAPAPVPRKAPPAPTAAAAVSEAGPSSAGIGGARRPVRAVRASNKVAEATETAEAAIKAAERAEAAAAAAAKKMESKGAKAAAAAALGHKRAPLILTEEDLVPGPSQTLTMFFID